MVEADGAPWLVAPWGGETNAGVSGTRREEAEACPLEGWGVEVRTRIEGKGRGHEGDCMEEG